MMISAAYDSERIKVGTAGSLLVTVFRGTPSMEDFDAMDRLQGELIAQHGAVSVLSIIGQLGAMLRNDEALRERSAALARKYEKNTRGGAIVVTTKGLAAVMVRTFLSAFFLFTKSGLQMKTFSGADEALFWLQSLPEQAPEVKVITITDLAPFIGLS